MAKRRFVDSWRRIDRAASHVAAVAKQWDESLDPEGSYKLVRLSDTSFVACLKMKRHNENDMALELGEFFYQLRAALDGLAYEVMVLDTGSNPPPKVNRIEFPIYEDKDRFYDCPFIKLTAFPKELVEWLESVQPFSIGLSADFITAETGRLLKLLHDFARMDRHRKLHVVVAGLTDLRVRIMHTANITISNLHPIPINFLSEETAFVGFDAVIVDVPESSLRVISDGAVEFGLMEFPNHLGYSVASEINRIIAATQHVVQRFENGYPL